MSETIRDAWVVDVSQENGRVVDIVKGVVERWANSESPPAVVMVDTAGIGAAVADRLMELGVPCQPFRHAADLDDTNYLVRVLTKALRAV
jgi:hypothetical protein